MWAALDPISTVIIKSTYLIWHDMMNQSTIWCDMVWFGMKNEIKFDSILHASLYFIFCNLRYITFIQFLIPLGHLDRHYGWIRCQCGGPVSDRRYFSYWWWLRECTIRVWIGTWFFFIFLSYSLFFPFSLILSLSPSFSLSIPLLLHEPTKCFSSIKVSLCYQPQFLFFLSFFHSFFLTFESSAGFLLQISLSSTGCLSRFKIHRTF